MKLDVTIDTDKYCNILIQDNSIYQEEWNNNINPNIFKLSDVVSITSVIHSDQREDKLVYFNIHKNSTKFKVSIDFDGPFTIKYIILPTKKWYDDVLKKVSKENLLKAFKGRIYIYDENKIIYITPDIEENIDIQDFIDTNYQDNLSVASITKDLLSICKLRKCYINLCQQIFDNKNFSPCWSKNKVDSELIYKRDLLWMTINVITYLWKQGKNIQEIERILKQINKCNGICDPYPNNSNNKSNGCGCSGK